MGENKTPHRKGKFKKRFISNCSKIYLKKPFMKKPSKQKKYL
jgi:hypothetical protein